MNVNDVRIEFRRKLKNEEFVIDKNGSKTVELIGISFEPTESSIFGKVNHDYIKKEIEWYDTQSLNVYDMSKTPQIWRLVCDNHGYINSNYGWSIYSKENVEQYKHCLRTLRKDKDSRRAMMIYTRPSMQVDYNKNGMSDFICTNNTQVLIRDNQLHYIINQRSMDAVFGYKNDIAWHKTVQNRLYADLIEDYPQLTKGPIHYQVGSLHVYERHFKFIEDIQMETMKINTEEPNKYVTN